MWIMCGRLRRLLVSVPLSGSLRRSLLFKTGTLHVQLDDIMRLFPTFTRGRSRASQPLNHHHLPPDNCEGLNIASHQGLQ